ncbi:YcgN family cysteine cluster protein [Aestuariibacter sp. A3R04]|uniref:YcgN family cysteine cluster protein n=1 Tax=Aestuariibacter sp. A3R04 TaxID=2841571 RepID=UPI001C093B5D|nr:YcgN family cysteine cluster protein [Aestuariibacter sp. A3R04]MBU3023327.1 YcgN family cysteine cluster protein [Aestuariibacter sp. A3R04]
MSERFWETKSLEAMTDDEWESVCDGCAKCCLHKFIDDEEADEAAPTDVLRQGEEIIYTNIACSLLNTKTCACTKYNERTVLVPDCVKLTKENLKDIFFMPPSCSYRRLQEGQGLPSWHPLLNKGKKARMHQSGMSVRGKAVFETDVDLEHFEDYIASWPLENKD